MGKYKHEGKGRNISLGGGQERKDLFKDMSGGYNAMGDSNSPNYKYDGSAFKQRYSSPMEKYGPLKGNAFGHAMQKAGGDYDKAKSMLEMKGSHSPTYKTGCVSGSGSNAPYKLMGDPNKKMDRLSAKHKSLYDRFEMGQTSEAEEQRMYRLEDRMDKVGKKIKKSRKSPLNQGLKEMSKAELQKMLKEKQIKPGDIKSKKALSISEKPKDKKKKDIIKSKNKKVIKATKKKMTTGRGKTTKSPLNQGKKEVKTLGEKETRQDRRAGKDNLVPSYFGVGGDDPKKTKLQRDAKERTSDPDYKKPKAKTLKKSPLNQGLKTDLFPDFKPSGRNPNYKPGVKDEKQKTKKEKRKHKKTMKKLGRIVGKSVKKMTKKNK